LDLVENYTAHRNQFPPKIHVRCPAVADNDQSLHSKPTARGFFDFFDYERKQARTMADFLRGLDHVGSPAKVPSADVVATLIGSHGSIDTAAEALRNAGWRSTVSGSRINIGDRVFARIVNSNDEGATWVIYGIGDQPPVRIVALAANADLGNEVR
jgi:hypothetical protein